MPSPGSLGHGVFMLAMLSLWFIFGCLIGVACVGYVKKRGG